jgi:hypothetical protein
MLVERIKMYQDNKTFLEELEQDYPDVDWDNLPDLDSAEDEYFIDGLQYHRLHFSHRVCETYGERPEKDIISKIGIELGPYKTEEEAEEMRQKMLTEDRWQKEQLEKVGSELDPIRSDKYFGPVINDSLKIQKRKPRDLVMLHTMKSLRDRVLQDPDKQIFPMYLP